MAASSKSTIHGCAQKASFCPRPSLVCDGLCQETCRKDTPHSTLTCRLVGNRCRHASSPALQSCPGGVLGPPAAESIIHSAQGQRAAKATIRCRRSLESTCCCKRHPAVVVPMSSCASTSPLTESLSPWSMRRDTVNAQGLGPWSAWCTESLQGCAEDGKGTVQVIRASVDEQLTPSSQLFLFLHPSQACRRLMSNASYTFLASSGASHPNVPHGSELLPRASLNTTTKLYLRLLYSCPHHRPVSDWHLVCLHRQRLWCAVDHLAPWECQESIAHFKAARWLVLARAPTSRRNQLASA